MTAVDAVQVGVVLALAVGLAAKIRAQRRRGIRPIVIGKAQDGLPARLEPLSLAFVFCWFGAIALEGLGWAPELFEPRLFRSARAQTVGVLLALVGLTLQLTALAQMGRAWRIGIDPGSREQLVTGGVFGISRNPIYLAIDSIAVAAFLLSGSVFFLVSGVLVIVGIHVQILREERFLASAFTEEYERYRARVRRYLGRGSAR